MYAAHYSVGLSLGLYACMHQVCPALVAAEVTQPAATQSSNTSIDETSLSSPRSACLSGAWRRRALLLRIVVHSRVA